MSVKIMGEVWELDLKPAQQIVLLALADHADHNGDRVFPSVALIAWKTNYTRRQVQRIMRELEACKVLVPVRERKGKTTMYRIAISAGTPKQPFDEVRKVYARKNVTRDIAMSHDPSVSSSSSKTENENRPNIYALYEANIGSLTPMIADSLKDAAKTYPEVWIEEAFAEAVKHNKRSWAYAEKILRTWQDKGRGEGKAPDAPSSLLKGLTFVEADDSIYDAQLPFGGAK